MANTTTQAIILKDFTGGLWLNEGEPPSNKFAPFMENLDLLLGGGVQKRQPMRLNYKISNSRTLGQINTATGTNPSMVADPTNPDQYVICDDRFSPHGALVCVTTGSSIPQWAADTGVVPGTVLSFHYASSDAGGFWYTHCTGAVARITTAGVVTTMGTTYNDNLAAPTNGNVPQSTMGVQHLAAYHFVADIQESGAILFPHRIRWSHPGRFEDYRNNDKLDVGDRSKIVGLFSVNDVLVIVKINSVWVLTGYDPDTFQLHKVADLSVKVLDQTVVPIAACSHNQHGVFIFVAGSGVFHFDGKTFKDVSGGLKDAIKDGRILMRNMAFLGDTVFGSNTATAVATADSQTDLTWQYDLRSEAWTQHTAGFRALCSVKSTATGSPVGYALHGHGTAGGYSFSWYRQQVAAGSWCDNQFGSDSDIVCQYRSPWQDAKNPARKKRWRRPWFVFNKRPNASASDPATYTLTIFKDWDGVHPTKTSTFAATKAVDTTDYNSTFGYGHATTGSDYDEGGAFSAPGSGYAMQVLISSTGTPKDQWGFDSLTFKFVPRSLR